MTTSVTLLLDNRRAKADGTYPLIVRIIHNRSIAQITLGTYLLEKDWNEEKRVIKTSFKGTESVTRLNNYIQKKKTQVSDFVTKLDEIKVLHTIKTANQIKELFEKKSDNLSFFKYTQKLIAELKAANRIGNARSYSFVLSVLKKYCNDKELSFSDLNYTFLVKFEASHLGKGNKINSLAVYMRTIRAVYNRAIKDGLVERELYPFTNYKIKTKKTQKRAISMDAIEKIVELPLEPNDPLYHPRNYFLMSFYMRGIPFADLAQLKLSNVISGRIYYQRKKTDKPYNIKITDEIEGILNIYAKDKQKDDYIFPIIKRTEPAEQYKDVEWARNRYNKKLTKLAERCDIEENLTSYVSRHSFATQAKNLGIPIAAISDMLGHESTKTTEIYLDSLPSEIMDQYHEQVITTNIKKKFKKHTNSTA
ncbi:MAG: site-specific integrase [Bacteroidota bacterium]|nr:site-specific integrase [Bacteroidota bacterium]